jgi:hypothetical protein
MTFSVTGFSSVGLKNIDATGDSVQFSNFCDNNVHSSISISFEDSGEGGGEEEEESDESSEDSVSPQRLDISYSESTGGIAFQDSQAQVPVCGLLPLRGFVSVVDPDPPRSQTFDRIRIRNSRL